jgi:hypothetical protein
MIDAFDGQDMGEDCGGGYDGAFMGMRYDHVTMLYMDCT